MFSNNIFGTDGVEKVAQKFKKNLLGDIPLHQDLRTCSDEGKPLTLEKPEHEISKIFINIAKKII